MLLHVGIAETAIGFWAAGLGTSPSCYWSRVSAGALIHGVGQIASAFLIRKVGHGAAAPRRAARRRDNNLIRPMITWGEDLGRLIPHRLLKAGQTHHPAVVEEAIKRNRSVQPA